MILENWTNPISFIKDPLKKRFASIQQTMNTHVNGVCPIHLYVNRRPLESNNTYALEYRVNNFQPLTKDPFDRAINGIIEICNSANIQINANDIILKGDYKIKGIDVYNYCTSDLIRAREIDPNSVIVVVPKIRDIGGDKVVVSGVEVLHVNSADIDIITDNAIRFIGGYNNEYPFYYHFENGQYSLSYPNDKGDYTNYPLVKLSAKTPHINVSNNIVFEGKYKLRLPYLFGAAAWGDKFYSQESDFTVQATRYTYIKEIRAKERCDNPTAIELNGLHVDPITNKPCVKCNGSGFVKDDSPLGTIYVDYSKLNSEERAFPQVIQWAEPPQSALINNKNIVDDYFSKMCESLGLIKQNNTNQSAVSKDFDYKEKLSMIYVILNDNIRVLQEIYRLIEYFLINDTEQTTQVYYSGELGKINYSNALEELNNAKASQAPPYVITNNIDRIYSLILPPENSDLIISIAKDYDKLYNYSVAEIGIIRAQFGQSITERDIIVHNTIISELVKYLSNHDNSKETSSIYSYLDNIYSKYDVKNNAFSL